MHMYKPERFSVGYQALRKPVHSLKQLCSTFQPNFVAASSLATVKNYSSCGVEATTTVYPIYMPPLCAPLESAPKANASLFVPFLLLFL